MRRRTNRHPAAFVVLLLAGALASLPAMAVERRAIGPWTLMSGKERDGVAYCTVEIRDGNRRAGLQVRLGGERYFGLTNPDWNWQVRGQYPLTLIAGKTRWAGPAVAALPEVLGMRIGPTPDAIVALETGERLDVEVGETRMSFSLKDFKPVAAALRTCLGQAS